MMAISVPKMLSAQGNYVVPRDMSAEAYLGHAELRWENEKGFDYAIFRASAQDSNFTKVGETRGESFLDFWDAIPAQGTEYVYRILPLGIAPDSDGAEKFETRIRAVRADDETLMDMHSWIWFRDTPRAIFTNSPTPRPAWRANDPTTPTAT